MMLTRVDFYLLTPAVDNGLVTACRLVEKAYVAGHTVFVLCANAEQAAQLDTQLWTFRDISFVPHGLASNETTAPVLLGLAIPPGRRFDILLNLTTTIPEAYQDFQRLMQIIASNESQRIQGRELYKHYRELGCELHTHTLE